MTPLHDLARKKHVAVILVHHLRKMGAGDVFDEVSGSTGITGAADTTMILKRERGQNEAVLYVTGRDVEEQELALTFSPEFGTWTLTGTAHDARMSDERKEIIALLKGSGGLGPKKIATLLGKGESAVKKLLGKLVDAGDLSNTGGKYYIQDKNRTTPGYGPNPTPHNPTNEEVKHQGAGTVQSYPLNSRVGSGRVGNWVEERGNCGDSGISDSPGNCGDSTGQGQGVTPAAAGGNITHRGEPALQADLENRVTEVTGVTPNQALKAQVTNAINRLAEYKPSTRGRAMTPEEWETRYQSEEGQPTDDQGGIELMSNPDALAAYMGEEAPDEDFDPFLVEPDF